MVIFPNTMSHTTHKARRALFSAYTNAKRFFFKEAKRRIIMETVTIKKEEYERLKQAEKLDRELLEDISRGIKDILSGRVKEV